MASGGRTNRRTVIASTLALVAISAVFAYPFVWMFFATFKSNPEIVRTLPLLPSRFDTTYYRELLDGTWIPFLRQYLNSLIVASVQTVVAVTTSVMAGFVLATYRFRGARLIIVLLIALVAMPAPVLVLPLFTWFNRLHLIDTLPAAILPGTVSAIGLLFFIQAFRTIPGELLDIARTEGASEYGVFLTLLPLVKNAIFTFGLIHFVLAWQEHLIPLVMLSSAHRLTVPIALSSLYGSARVPYALLMVGALLTVIPPTLLYLLVRRHFDTALSRMMGIVARPGA
jgi:ABC-type glycerol-3-phosphate transport system permease component